MAITLPVNPSVSSASVGKDYLLKINTGTAASPVWTIIGGQRSADLSRSADSIDAWRSKLLHRPVVRYGETNCVETA